MDPHYACAAFYPERQRWSRAVNALFRQRYAEDCADKFFPRRAQHNRPAEAAKLVEPVQEREVVLERLAEPDSGIDKDLLGIHTRLDGDRDPFFEMGHDIENHIVIDRILLHVARR